MKRALFLLVISCSMVVSSACSSTGAVDSNTNAGLITVGTSVIRSQSVPVTRTLSGTLKAYEEAAIAFELSGLVQEAYFNIGDTVIQDQVLARLDSSTYQLQLDKVSKSIIEAQTGIKNAAAEIAAADASVASAEAQMAAAGASLNKTAKGARQQEKDQARAKVSRAESSLDKTQADANRIQSLYEQGAISKHEYEQAQLALTIASRDLEDAQNALSLLEEGATREDLTTAESGVRQAQAARLAAMATLQRAGAAYDQAESLYQQAIITKKEAELSLSKTALTSPISGVILEKNVNAGELTPSGQSIYRIGKIDQLKLLLPVPDHEIKQWKVGDKVSLSLYDQTRNGTVRIIHPATHSSTGTVDVEVILSNSDHSWAPGQVVKATLSTQQAEQLLIPTKAVLNNGNETYVYRIEEQRAVKTVVITGALAGNQLEITEGLSAGDVIVTSGAGSLYDGLAVQAVEEQTHD
ncbi:Efflux pump periplasmic linker BepD precursor [compost metagenome]